LRLVKSAHAHVACSRYEPISTRNLFNTTYSVGRSTDGVVSIGAPMMVHGGVRISLR